MFKSLHVDVWDERGQRVLQCKKNVGRPPTTVPPRRLLMTVRTAVRPVAGDDVGFNANSAEIGRGYC